VEKGGEKEEKERGSGKERGSRKVGGEMVSDTRECERGTEARNLHESASNAFKKSWGVGEFRGEEGKKWKFASRKRAANVGQRGRPVISPRKRASCAKALTEKLLLER